MNLLRAIFDAFFSVTPKSIFPPRPEISNECHHDWQEVKEESWGRFDAYKCAKCHEKQTDVWEETAH